jgi:hypothetical protein
MFVEIDGAWRLLDMPSAFEMTSNAHRWIYRHDAGTIQVRAEAGGDAHELTLVVEVAPAKPLRLLITHHIALNGDDGSTAGPALWRTQGDAIIVTPAAGSETARRFPNGSIAIAPLGSTEFQRVGGDACDCWTSRCLITADRCASFSARRARRSSAARSD